MGAKIASTFYHKGVVTKMDTVILNNGVEMPMIGIGTSMLDEEACERTVREALEMGYRFVDTAQSYRNEGAVGRAVRQSGVKRKDVFIATKLTIANTTYEKAKESCKRSLDRLGVSAIDLLLLQYPYNDVFGAWRALTELCEEGLVHAIGVCNFAADRLADLVLHVKERPQVAQFERHPYYQRPQLMEYLRRQDIQPLARGPFAGCKTDLLQNPTVCAIASAHGKTPCQVLLRWQTLRDVAVIPTTAGSDELAENLASFDFELSADERAALDTLERDESALPANMMTPDWIEKLCRG